MEELSVEAAERGLKELVRSWFTDTQASHLLQDGSFPGWFHGFAARKDTEDLLRDKSLGCFLVRLSHKTIGYILSYRGRDRCRHLVITQNAWGEFTLRGGGGHHASLAELLRFHRLRPIQPFREYLTSSCSQGNGGELYDVVDGGSGLSVLALRNLWDRGHGRPIQPRQEAQRQQVEELPVPPPVLPPKRKDRKLTGAVSMDTVVLTQVGQRGTPTSNPRHLGGLDPDGAELPEQGQVDRSRPDSPADEDESCRPPSSSSAAPLKATRSLLPAERSSSASNAPAEGEEFRRNPLYLTCGGAEEGSVQRGGPTYAEVLQRPTSTRRTLQEPDPGNTYESVEEVKEKNSTWGRKNIKWRHFLPDSKKKPTSDKLQVFSIKTE